MTKEEMQKSRNELFLWIISIIFVVGGMVILSDSFLAGVFALVAGAIICPPVTQIIKDRSKGKAKTWMFVATFIVLILFIGMALPDKGNSQNQVSNPVYSNGNDQQAAQEVRPTINKNYISKTYDDICWEFGSGSLYTGLQKENIFNEDYRGKYANFSGHVKNIDTSILDNLILEVDMSCGTGTIYMNKDQYNRLLLLNKEESVTFSGRFSTEPTPKIFSSGVHVTLKVGELI